MELPYRRESETYCQCRCYQHAAVASLQCCGYSRKVETLSFFAHGGGSFETQVKKLLNDRNSEMDLRHANEYDKLGQDWGYATFLSGP